MTSPDRIQDQLPSDDQPGVPPAAGTGPPPAAAPPAAAPPATAAVPRQHVVRRTRLGGAWFGFAVGAVILILLLVFILENGHKVDISFFGAHGHLPLGVALLLAAALGILLVVIPGSGRIIQLRRTARRHRKADVKAAAAPAAPPAAPADGTAIER
jgi:lipopolysaccharide assembly protein A